MPDKKVYDLEQLLYVKKRGEELTYELESISFNSSGKVFFVLWKDGKRTNVTSYEFYRDYYPFTKD